MKKRAAGVPPDLADDRLLSLEEVLARVPVHRVTLWRLIRDKKFPKPIAVTTSRLGWRLSSVLQWMREREASPIDRRAYTFEENSEPTTTA